jgi:hypothetical protein
MFCFSKCIINKTNNTFSQETEETSMKVWTLLPRSTLDDNADQAHASEKIPAVPRAHNYGNSEFKTFKNNLCV